MPHVISVAGFTSKGRVEIAETDIFFTEEGGTSICTPQCSVMFLYCSAQSWSISGDCIPTTERLY